jgi:translation initiation factor IF-1
MPSKSYALTRKPESKRDDAYFVLEEYLVTAFVPSDTACLASSPGRMRRTDVWISRDEMVDFLLYAASLEASVATRSKMSVMRG